jgi:uncharacterized membrane protein
MSTTTSPVQRGKRYRRLIYGLLTVAIVSLLIGILLEQFFAGLVVYAVTGVGAIVLTFYLQYYSSVSLEDERERELGRHASNITFQLFGYLGLFAFVTLFFLDALGRYSLDGTVMTLLYAYAVVYLTWGGVYIVLRYRS